MLIPQAAVQLCMYLGYRGSGAAARGVRRCGVCLGSVSGASAQATPRNVTAAVNLTMLAP